MQILSSLLSNSILTPSRCRLLLVLASMAWLPVALDALPASRHQAEADASHQPLPPTVPFTNKRVLFWDDFNGPLNESVWSFDYGDGSQFGIPQWGNGEQQFYTRESVQSGVDDTMLQITAERNEAGQWTSGKIHTKSAFSFTYGRVDVRAKLSTEDGVFPAIWMLPRDSNYGGWPNSGEIDVAEYQSKWRVNGVHRAPQTLHFGKRHGGDALTFWSEEDVSGWHTFTMIWSPDRIEFQRDLVPIGGYSRPDKADSAEWPYNKPFYLIINLAIEPSWGTKVNSDDDEHTLQVDWIRVTEL